MFCSQGTVSENRYHNAGCCQGGDWITAVCTLPPPPRGLCDPESSIAQGCTILPRQHVITSGCDMPVDGGMDAAMDASADSGQDDDDAGTTDSGTDSSTGSAGSGGPVGVGGCPQIGQHSVAVGSGSSCGDLDANAPRQRLDGIDGCLRYFEFDDGGGEGIATPAVTFNPSGVTSLAIDLGSNTYDCTVTVSNGQVTMDLECTYQGAECNLHLQHTGPL